MDLNRSASPSLPSGSLGCPISTTPERGGYVRLVVTPSEEQRAIFTPFEEKRASLIPLYTKNAEANRLHVKTCRLAARCTVGRASFDYVHVNYTVWYRSAQPH